MLWKSFNVEERSEVDMMTFIEQVKDFRIQALFHRLGLEIEAEYLPGLFALLDFNGNGKVDIDEFAMGIQMLHGPAKSIDLAHVRHVQFTMKKQLDQILGILTGSGASHAAMPRIGKTT